MQKFNSFLTTRAILDLKMLLDGVRLNEKLCLKKEYSVFISSLSGKNQLKFSGSAYFNTYNQSIWHSLTSQIFDKFHDFYLGIFEYADFFTLK